MPGASGGAPVPDDLARGLARIRQRRLGLLLVHVHAPWDRAARDVLVLAWVAAWAVAVLAAAWSRCPRCGHLFHRVVGFGNPLARRCQGCGQGL